MKKLTFVFVSVMVLGIALWSLAFGADIIADKDTFIWEKEPNDNWGGSEFIYIEKKTGEYSRCLLFFDRRWQHHRRLPRDSLLG
jgi:hypothetical protein